MVIPNTRVSSVPYLNIFKSIKKVQFQNANTHAQKYYGYSIRTGVYEPYTTFNAGL